MRTYLTLIVMLLTSIYMLDNLPVFNAEKLPMSQPTPVEQFMDRIAQFESGNNHRIVNQYGMMGKYQFSPSALRAVGITASRENFLKNPELQDTAMVRLMKIHEQDLAYYIDRYDGKTVKGVKITRAAIIAGAHFAGAGGVREFFTTNTSTGTIDGNGTSLRYYMSRFSNFNLPKISL